jgi:hypothetical protein
MVVLNYDIAAPTMLGVHIGAFESQLSDIFVDQGRRLEVLACDIEGKHLDIGETPISRNDINTLDIH